MAKKTITYPNDTPNNIQEISKKFIRDYIQGEIAKKAITEAMLDEWIEALKKVENDSENDTPIKKFHAERRAFADMFFKHLTIKEKQEKESDFYTTLKTISFKKD